MKTQLQISNNSVVFSKWTRKSYAIFSSLKKVVKIAQLSIDVFKSSFTNLPVLSALLNNIESDEIANEDSCDSENHFTVLFNELLVALGLVKFEKAYSLQNTESTNQCPYSLP